MGAWSDRADLLCVGCERNVVIGSVHLSIDFDAPTSRTSSIFLRRIIGSSLTTSVRVKTHLLRSGRRSRLSIAQSRRRRPSLCRRDFRCPHFALDPCHCITTVSAPNISSVTVDHDDSCELPPLEGGGSPNQCCGHSRTRTRADTGIPARTPRLRLPRQPTTAEFCVVNLIAQHDPETNAQARPPPGRTQRSAAVGQTSLIRA
jgi:hypothetical protein